MLWLIIVISAYLILPNIDQVDISEYDENFVKKTLSIFSFFALDEISELDNKHGLCYSARLKFLKNTPNTFEYFYSDFIMIKGKEYQVTPMLRAHNKGFNKGFS